METVGTLDTYNGYDVQYEGNALYIEPGMDYDTWSEFTAGLVGDDVKIKFRIGDALNYGKEEFGEDYYQFFDQFDYEEGTLKNYAWVARKIPPAERVDGLYWSHFFELAPVKDPAVRQELVDDLLSGEIATVQELKDRKNGIDGQTEHIESVECEACYGAGRLLPEEAQKVSEFVRSMRGLE